MSSRLGNQIKTHLDSHSLKYFERGDQCFVGIAGGDACPHDIAFLISPQGSESDILVIEGRAGGKTFEASEFVPLLRAMNEYSTHHRWPAVHIQVRPDGNLEIVCDWHVALTPDSDQAEVDRHIRCGITGTLQFWAWYEARATAETALPDLLDQVSSFLNDQ